MTEVKLKIKTPIWTGDIDSKSNVFKATGIMGSLRWWTEAVLRGLGHFVCDPTSTERCPEKENNQQKYCTACLMFGATGLRKAFKIELNGGTAVFAGGALNIKPNGRNRGWYLGSGIIGDIELKIVPLVNEFDPVLILLPLKIASDWGAIGAKIQLGYGVVEMNSSIAANYELFKTALDKINSKEGLGKMGIGLRNSTNTTEKLPDIKEMFFAKVQFEVNNNDWWKNVEGIKKLAQRNDNRLINWKNSGSVPVAPAIKNWMRFSKTISTRNNKTIQVSPFNEISNKAISNWLLGNPDERDKTSSKINISCAYKINNNLWKFRIWGWVPKNNLPTGFDRESFLNNLKTALQEGSNPIPWTEIFGDQTQSHHLAVWHEFDSPRDTNGKTDNINEFIKTLIGGQNVS